MAKLTHYFAREEFACGCGCGFDTVDYTLATVLEQLRFDFKRAVAVTSGARCAKHNKAVGGEPDSQHLKGKAADIQVAGISTSDVYTYLNKRYPDRFGLGVYDGWVHIDVRGGYARWDKRTS